MQRMAGSGEATETWSALKKKKQKKKHNIWATVLEIPIGRLRHFPKLLHET